MAPVKNSLTKLDRLPLDPALLERVPFLSGHDRAGWHIQAIGSITNQTYRLDVGQDSYVVRVAGPTTRYLDRAVETHNAAIAADLGLAPPVLYLDDKLLVTRFVTGARPLSAGDLGGSSRLQQVGDLLSRISQTLTLNPGDVLATGTPEGVGYVRTPPWYLRPGDVVEVEVERLGSIRTPVVDSSARP